MKKFFVVATCLFLTIALFVSFNRKQAEIVRMPTSEAIECTPFYEYDPTVRAFVFTPTATPLIRRNINSSSFNIASWKLLSRAYRIMKIINNSSDNQPTSWDFQAKIHGGNPTKDPLYHTCQHGNCFFLAWHRMYLYFFERIFRQKLISTGVPVSLIPALPYWNSKNESFSLPPILNNDVMPSKFRQRKITPTIINYLYEKDASIVGDNTKPRGYNINRNYPLTHLDVTTGGPGAIEFGYDAAFSYTNFHKFQNAIEKPHNNIHIKIGGTYMPSQNYAAYDPIFYTHHANIDRLWQNWLKLGKGRCNPNEEDDKEWMNTVFNFYDEYGKPVSLTVKDILTIAPQLNYVYDDYTKEEDYLPKEECDKSYKNCESFPYAKGSSKIIKIVLPKYIIQAKISTSKEANSIVLGDEKMFKNGKIYINDTENSDMVFLEFDKIDILQKPEAAIEIYINPKDINKLFPSNLSYAGTVNLFSTGQNEFKHHSNTKDVIIINDVIKKLNLDVEQLKKVKLVFVVRGNFIDGNEVTTTTNVIINEAAIIVYKKSP